jgi:nicotinate-nucleotide adenylyltransferase
MKLLIFGGSFDPPHIGHMNLLKNAVGAVRPDKVMVIPSGAPPHKQASATAGNVRAAMCECFVPLFEGLEVSDMELRRRGKSYTAQTLAKLQKENPAAQLYLCIGGDMLLGFEGWYRWRWLLKAAVLVVAGRAPGTGPALEAQAARLTARGGRVLFAEGPVVAAASSEIRRALGEGRDVYAQIPPPAAAIARAERLYQSGVTG